ncbi:hypothetical protein [Sedimentibacter sp.]|uniref:hypothetical protein n=1 Tax=Sedimentibacter sp. TaxID=1960295 RepID=UPI00289EF9E9|nr:hypothetical protein [Sedimentibacter sp.]
MILELLLIPAMNLMIHMLSGIPVVEMITMPSDVLTFIINIIAVCGYFLPLGDMLVMFGIWVAYTVFRLNINFFKALWEAIPFIN